MALTIAIEGKGVIANCDSVSNDTGGSGGGTWAEQGGGTLSLTTDVYLYGTSSIAGKYASKSGYQRFTMATADQLDFSVGGAEEGQLIYMWVNLSTFGVLQPLGDNGLAIRISSNSLGTSDYKDFTIAGSDGANGWTGGWKLFVIDPTSTASVSNGTIDLANIINMGVWIDTAESVRAESIFIDQIAVGTGLRIKGTSTTGWKDVVDYCTDYANRAWGMMQELDGIYYAYGKFYIGDETNQSANVSFADSARVIQFGTSQYYESSAWKSSFPSDAAGIIVEDHTSYTTTFSDGVIVGTDNGRSGTVFIGNNDQDVSLNVYGGNNTSSVTTLYGSIFKSMYGLLQSGDDINHKILGVTFTDCEQFRPLGAVVIRNCAFTETAAVDGALLWDEDIDIEESVFIANTSGAAIEHDTSTGTPYDYYDLVFSANTYDGYNSSGTNITVNNNGTSNAADDTGPNTITYLSSATLTLTVKDELGNAVGSANAYIDDDNESPFIMNTTTNATTGVASVNWTGGAVTAARWRVRKYGFKPYSASIDIPASGTVNIPVTLIKDPQQT